jgi:hypothetical protein
MQATGALPDRSLLGEVASNDFKDTCVDIVIGLYPRVSKFSRFLQMLFRLLLSLADGSALGCLH